MWLPGVTHRPYLIPKIFKTRIRQIAEELVSELTTTQKIEMDTGNFELCYSTKCDSIFQTISYLMPNVEYD